MTADNQFEFFADGKSVGASPPTGVELWRQARNFHFSLDPNAKSHLFAVKVTNDPDTAVKNGPTPAGLLGVVYVKYEDGTVETIPTDGSWVANRAVVSGFQDPAKSSDSSWEKATVIAKYGGGEWGTQVAASDPPTPSASTSTTPDASSSPPSPSAPASEFSLTNSKWIWKQESSPAPEAPAGAHVFRMTHAPTGKTAKEASAIITVDNNFTLYVNGQRIGASTKGWEVPLLYSNIKLEPSKNVFSILANNYPADNNSSATSAAGVLAAFQVTYTDGSKEVLHSDVGSWLVSDDQTTAAQVDVVESAWKPVVVVGKFGDSPWIGLQNPEPAVQSSSAVISGGASTTPLKSPGPLSGGPTLSSPTSTSPSASTTPNSALTSTTVYGFLRLGATLSVLVGLSTAI